MYRYYLYHPDLKKPVKLRHEPVGWDSLNKKLTRDRTTHGVFFGYTPKLKFIKDGKAIIHTLYELYGPEADIIIMIDILNKSTRKFERDYTGKLNLMTLNISTLFAECNVEQTGFVQKFKNRLDVKVNTGSLVDLDNNAIAAFTPEVVDISLHSQVIQSIDETDGVRPIDNEGSPIANGTYYMMFGQEPLKSQELEEYSDYGTHVSSLNPVTYKKYLRKFKYAGSYTINIVLEWYFRYWTATVANYSAQWKIAYGQNGVYTTVNIGALFSTTGVNHVEGFGTYNNTLNLIAGDEIYLFGEVVITSQPDGFVIFNPNSRVNWTNTDTPSSLKITGLTTYPATATKTVLANEAFARVCQAITGKPDAFRSNYYGRTDSDPVTYAADGKGSLRGIIPGFWVRGFPTSSKPLHCSFKDLYETFAMLDGIGVGIELIAGKEYVVVEDLGYFYQATECMKLNHVKDIEKEVAEDYYFNEFEIGYKKWSVTGGRVSHLDEFNARREYSLPISQVKKKLSLVSPYIGGGYALEVTRRDSYKVSNTKDNENDNENFVVQLKRNGATFGTAKNEAFTTLTGVISPSTVYNVNLSIGRAIRNNGKLLRSFLEKYKDKSMRLVFSEGNKDMASKRTDETVTINEGADVVISTLDKPLWLPEVYKFKAPLTSAQIAAMTSTPYGYVSFSNTDKDHKRCFILEAERDAKTRLVKFYRTKSEPLTQLIKPKTPPYMSIYNFYKKFTSGKNLHKPPREKALKEIRNEPKVKEAIIDEDILYVSVMDDGTKRHGYAEYLTTILKEHNIKIKCVKVVKFGSKEDPNSDNPYGVVLGTSYCSNTIRMLNRSIIFSLLFKNRLNNN